jgi:hypothetical protein
MRRATLILAAIAVAPAGIVVGAQAPPAYAHYSGEMSGIIGRLG